MRCDSSEVNVGRYPASVEEKLKESMKDGSATTTWGWTPKDQPYYKPEKTEVVTNTHILPTDPAERKKYPIGTGVLDYFSAALAEVARVSYQGNKQHNPGEKLHWARGKSTDQDDTIIRHFLERGGRDVDGMRHSAKLAWRALAALQLELEAEGAPVARGARLPEQEKS